MVVLVCLNMVILMVETDQQSLDKTVILYWFHLIFIFIFFIEFLLKILALRKHYFNSGWNILDFVVIVDSIVGESVNFILVMLLMDRTSVSTSSDSGESDCVILSFPFFRVDIFTQITSDGQQSHFSCHGP